MLDGRWKRIAQALKVYALALLVGLVAALSNLLLVMLPALGVESVALIGVAAVGVLALDAFALVGFVVGTGALLVYASVPAESGARLTAVVAAASAVLQLFVAASSLLFALLDADALLALVNALEPLLALVTLTAMSRSLMKVGAFIRADEVYGRANMLFVGLLLLLGGGACLVGSSYALASAGVAVPLVAMVVALAGAVFALMIAIAYLILVWRAGAAIDELRYE